MRPLTCLCAVDYGRCPGSDRCPLVDHEEPPEPVPACRDCGAELSIEDIRGAQDICNECLEWELSEANGEAEVAT